MHSALRDTRLDEENTKSETFNCSDFILFISSIYAQFLKKV